MTKRCADCKKYKPVAEFPRNKNSKDGFHCYCKDCNNARSRESRERLHGGSRHYHLKHRYGIGADENCNGGLGQFRDSIESLRNAATYLAQSEPEVREVDELTLARVGELRRTPG